jgi:hypothetical protein
LIGAWIETASAGTGQNSAGQAGSGTTLSSTARSGATLYSGDPDVGQNGNPLQKRMEPLTGGGRGSLPAPRDLWTMWIWAMWNLRMAR